MTDAPFAAPADDVDPLAEPQTGQSLPEAVEEPTTAPRGPRKSEAEKAKAALEVANRKVTSLRDRLAKAKADTARLEGELEEAVSKADYLAQHPALQG